MVESLRGLIQKDSSQKVSNGEKSMGTQRKSTRGAIPTGSQGRVMTNVLKGKKRYAAAYKKAYQLDRKEGMRQKRSDKLAKEAHPLLHQRRLAKKTHDGEEKKRTLLENPGGSTWIEEVRI